MVYAILAALGLGLLLVLWQVFGPGPRRRRALARVQRHLQQGDWPQALKVVQALEAGRLPGAWRQRLQQAAGECNLMAGDQALHDKRYEDSLPHFQMAARLLNLDEAGQHAKVVDAMLAELRRLFAAGTGPAETAAVERLLERLFTLQPSCAEALFWQALTQVRQGQTEPALATLATSYEAAGKQVIDPPFYLGALLHRAGRYPEALRYLAEANRLDGGCPLVTWQLGLTLVASGGDTNLATRALKRALGPRGLGLWANLPERSLVEAFQTDYAQVAKEVKAKSPERVWVEAFPENRSYVRRLASKHPYRCPVLGNDLNDLVHQGQLALAEAFYRQGNYADASDLFGKLLQECPPTVALLRGLGLSLARLQRYDQAYKHLRTALEMEEPKDPFTAGYLALCGALGKPTQPEDRARNVSWAIRLLARFQLPGNPEWAGLNNVIFAEARALELPLAQEDQAQLCDTLASILAHDAMALAAYSHLARTFPQAVQPVYAWLYARGAGLLYGGVGSDPMADGLSAFELNLDLLTRTFREPVQAREFFGRQQWDFDEVEQTFLAGCAAQEPGRFPAVLGPDYSSRGEAFLLERSRREEQAGRPEAALACVETLLRLAPGSLAAHDRLACLYYRRGNLDRALSLLADWQRLAPSDHWPLVRQAILEQERGQAARRAEAIDRALGLTRGRTRGGIAFLGARLALREWVRRVRGQEKSPSTNGKTSSPLPSAAPEPNDLALPFNLLQECLREDPDHVEALWTLAAVRAALGDRQGLAAQAPAMNRPGVKDSRFHYFGAVCYLATGEHQRVRELVRRVTSDEALVVESRYVKAWAHLHLGNEAKSVRALQTVAAAGKSPSAPFARGLLGRMSFARGSLDEAIRWWNDVEPQRRKEWGLDETLRQSVLLSGVLAFRDGRYELAADRFREAGRLGLRERRLGSLLTLALVKAGQRLLFQGMA